MSSPKHDRSVPIILGVCHPLLNLMPCNENCDTDGNIDKVDRPPMLTEPTMLMKLTASPAGRTSSSVVGGDGGRGGGIRGGWPWFSCPELIPPIRACFTFACITAGILYYVHMQGCTRARVSLHRGWEGGLV